MGRVVIQEEMLCINSGKPPSQLMQQSIGMMTRAVFVCGRRYTASLRHSFQTSSGRAAARLQVPAARFYNNAYDWRSVRA